MNIERGALNRIPNRKRGNECQRIDNRNTSCPPRGYKKMSSMRRNNEIK